MEKLGYHRSTHGKQPRFTPRGFKIDVYTDGLPGVSHPDRIRNARIIPVGKKGGIRVASLEALIASKFRAGREQDVEDLMSIAQHSIRDADWDGIKKITGNNFRARQIKADQGRHVGLVKVRTGIGSPLLRARKRLQREVGHAKGPSAHGGSKIRKGRAPAQRRAARAQSGHYAEGMFVGRSRPVRQKRLGRPQNG